MRNTHTFITANYDNAERCKQVANAFGLEIHSEYKPTCIKCYHITLTATTTLQDEILNLCILACTAHAEQDKYKKKLAERIATA